MHRCCVYTAGGIQQGGCVIGRANEQHAAEEGNNEPLAEGV